MPPFTVQDIVRATQGALVAGDLGVPVTGVSIDSRSLGVGEAFFAIRGHRLDGHAFLADAAARGAACLVVHALPDDVPAERPARAGRGHDARARPAGRVSPRAVHDPGRRGDRARNGKTTTKELIAGVLATRWERAQARAAASTTSGGFRSRCCGWRAEHQALVLEIGTNARARSPRWPRSRSRRWPSSRRSRAVHTEFLGSLDGVRDEKAGARRARWRPTGVAVLNADDARVAGHGARHAGARGDLRSRRPAPTCGRPATSTDDDGRPRASRSRAAASGSAVTLALRRPSQRDERAGRGGRRRGAGLAARRDRRAACGGAGRWPAAACGAAPASVTHPRRHLQRQPGVGPRRARHGRARTGGAPAGVVVVLGDMLELGDDRRRGAP